MIPDNRSTINKILTTTLDAKLPRLTDTFFQENPIYKWLMDEPFIITKRQIMSLQAALFKKSKAKRGEARKLLEELPKVKRDELKGKVGTKISYTRVVK